MAQAPTRAMSGAPPPNRDASPPAKRRAPGEAVSGRRRAAPPWCVCRRARVRTEAKYKIGPASSQVCTWCLKEHSAGDALPVAPVLVARNGAPAARMEPAEPAPPAARDAAALGAPDALPRNGEGEEPAEPAPPAARDAAALAPPVAEELAALRAANARLQQERDAAQRERDVAQAQLAQERADAQARLAQQRADVQAAVEAVQKAEKLEAQLREESDDAAARSREKDAVVRRLNEMLRAALQWRANPQRFSDWFRYSALAVYACNTKHTTVPEARVVIGSAYCPPVRWADYACGGVRCPKFSRENRTAASRYVAFEAPGFPGFAIRYRCHSKREGRLLEMLLALDEIRDFYVAGRRTLDGSLGARGGPWMWSQPFSEWPPEGQASLLRALELVPPGAASTRQGLNSVTRAVLDAVDKLAAEFPNVANQLKPGACLVCGHRLHSQQCCGKALEGSVMSRWCPGDGFRVVPEPWEGVPDSKPAPLATWLRRHT